MQFNKIIIIIIIIIKKKITSKTLIFNKSIRVNNITTEHCFQDKKVNPVKIQLTSVKIQTGITETDIEPTLPR
jgi:hypothetical protein